MYATIIVEIFPNISFLLLLQKFETLAVKIVVSFLRRKHDIAQNWISELSLNIKCKSLIQELFYSVWKSNIFLNLVNMFCQRLRFKIAPWYFTLFSKDKN